MLHLVRVRMGAGFSASYPGFLPKFPDEWRLWALLSGISPQLSGRVTGFVIPVRVFSPAARMAGVLLYFRPGFRFVFRMEVSCYSCFHRLPKCIKGIILRESSLQASGCVGVAASSRCTCVSGDGPCRFFVVETVRMFVAR